MMLSKSSIALLASAVLANGVVAANAHHRHAHQQMHQKKDVRYLHTEITTVTEWVTVTFDPDAPAPTVSMFAPGQHSEKFASVSSNSSSIASTTSSSTSTTPTSTSISTSSSIFVAPTPTTLVTTSSPAPASTSETPLINIQVAASVAASVEIGLTASVAADSTTAAAAATTAVSSSGKRGFAYNDATLATPLLGGKVKWGYNWGQSRDGLDDDLEYIPMLWGPASDHSSTWSASAKEAISAGSSALLSFNEPDNIGQANISPAQAAADHITYMNPFAGQARISSPAITNSASDGEGISWLTSWIDSCDGKCSFDFCAFHWYSPADSKEFLDHATAVHEACDKKPVWLTEFAPTGDDDTINDFLLEVMDQMDNNATYSFIERYSFFMLKDGSLVNDGAASVYGKSYAFS